MARATTSGDVAWEPEALVVSHLFDPGEHGQPFDAVVRVVGRHADATGGPPRPDDAFIHEETVRQIVPGAGPITITSSVYGLRPGDRHVSAELNRPATGSRSNRVPRGQRHTERLERVDWGWRRWKPARSPETPLRTRWALTAPLARMPGVLPGSWTVLALTGVVIALLTQSLILTRTSVPVSPAFLASLLVIGDGLIGAKAWYRVLHPAPWKESLRQGWSVDGFLLVAPVVAVVVLALSGLPVGTVLDASTPGIFFAVAIGRVGCFTAGCCVGRCTSSRWGLWSSDRRVGARRIPAQLIEAAIGLAIGLVALVFVGSAPGLGGVVFVTALLIYAIARQGLLRIRAESRRYSWQHSGLG